MKKNKVKRLVKKIHVLGHTHTLIQQEPTRPGTMTGNYHNNPGWVLKKVSKIRTKIRN